MKEIVIIDRDTATSNSISRLADAMRMKPVNLVSWNAGAYQFDSEITGVIFVNIEMQNINVQELVKTLSKMEANIPLVFIFSDRESVAYKDFQTLPHQAELLKPFKVELVYHLLHRYIKQNISNTLADVYAEYSEFLSGLSGFEHWMKNLKVLVNA